MQIPLQDGVPLVSDGAWTVSAQGARWTVRLNPPGAAPHCSGTDRVALPIPLSLFNLTRFRCCARRYHAALARRFPEFMDSLRGQTFFTWSDPVHHEQFQEQWQCLQHMERFLAHVPAPLAPFLETIPSGQLGLCRAYHLLGEPYIELLETNPMLAWMAAQPCFLPWDDDNAALLERLIRARRTAVLGALGFSAATPAVEHILRRVPAAHVNERNARRLRAALSDPGRVRLLSHLEIMHRSVIAIASRPALAALAAPALLRELSESGEEYRDGAALRALRRVAEAVRRGHPRPAPFTRREALLNWRGDAALVGEDNRSAALGDGTLPPAPFRVTDTPEGLVLEPLETTFALVRESRQMHHCIENYARRAHTGKYSVYRVLSPERATAGLRRWGGRWVLDEIRGRQNAEVSARTLEGVLDWLAAAQGLPPLVLMGSQLYTQNSAVSYAVAAAAREQDDSPFPEPPIPPAEGIVPVSSLHALCAHALRMRDPLLLQCAADAHTGALQLYAVRAEPGVPLTVKFERVPRGTGNVVRLCWCRSCGGRHVWGGHSVSRLYVWLSAWCCNGGRVLLGEEYPGGDAVAPYAEEDVPF